MKNICHNFYRTIIFNASALYKNRAIFELCTMNYLTAETTTNKKYPQRLSQDRHCGYTIINKRTYYIYNKVYTKV